MPLRPVALAALLALAAGSAHAQEPVLLRLGGAVGRAVRSRLAVNTCMRGLPTPEAERDTSLPSMRLEAHLTQTLDAVAGDTLSFTTVIDSARADVPGSPEVSAALQGITEGGWGRVVVKVDSRGRLLWVDPAEAAAAEGASLAAAARQLAGAAGPRDGGFVLPGGAVRVGDTWGDSTPLRSPGGRETRLRREYRLERIEPGGAAGTAIISLSATRSLELPAGTVLVPSAGIARFDVGAHRVTGYAITTVATLPTPTGEITTRTQMVMHDLGSPALAPPPLSRRPAEPAPQRPPER